MRKFVLGEGRIEVSANLQRTDAWWLERRGKITGSKVRRVLTGTPERGWKSLAADLTEEMRHETMPEGLSTYAMDRGELIEPQTLANAALDYGFKVIPVGFKQHPTIEYLGCSSDFLVRIGRSKKRVINGEAKSPLVLARHMRVVMNRQLPEEYKPQVQLEMECHGADVTYFISHHPDAPHWRQRTVKIEVPREQSYIDYMLRQCKNFWRFYTFTDEAPSSDIPETF